MDTASAANARPRSFFTASPVALPVAVEFTLTDEQALIRDMTRAFVGEHITPSIVRQWEQDGDHPHDI
jgi:hypothetical protein